MSIPTNDEILALLDQLDQGKCADELETEWLDFKGYGDPREEKRLAVEYAACFANGRGGVVVFGVSDKERGGRSKAIIGAKTLDVYEGQGDRPDSPCRDGPGLRCRLWRNHPSRMSGTAWAGRLAIGTSGSVSAADAMVGSGRVPPQGRQATAHPLLPARGALTAPDFRHRFRLRFVNT